MKTTMGLLLLLGVAIQGGLAGPNGKCKKAGGGENICKTEDKHVCCKLEGTGNDRDGTCGTAEECDAQGKDKVCVLKDQNTLCVKPESPAPKGKCNDGKTDMDCMFSTCCKLDVAGVAGSSGKCSMECTEPTTTCLFKEKDKVCNVPQQQLGTCEGKKKAEECTKDHKCCLLKNEDTKRCGDKDACKVDDDKKCTFEEHKDENGVYKKPCKEQDKASTTTTKNPKPTSTGDGNTPAPAPKDNFCKTKTENKKCAGTCCLFDKADDHKCGDDDKCKAQSDEKKKCTFGAKHPSLKGKDKPCDKPDKAAGGGNDNKGGAATAAGTGSLIAGLLLLLPIINHN